MKNRRSSWILPLRAQYMVIENAAVDGNLPRSYLERHLPYAAIHAALMDIAMGHQTAADDAKTPFTPEVFDPVEPFSPRLNIVAGEPCAHAIQRFQAVFRTR